MAFDNTEIVDDASVRRQKIYSFVGHMAWQACFLTVAIKASIYANETANTIIFWYAWFTIVMMGLMLLIVAVPTRVYEDAAEGMLKEDTPSARLITYISTFVSLIEIGLFMQYEMWFVMWVWIIGSLVSAAWRWKMHLIRKMWGKKEVA